MSDVPERRLIRLLIPDREHRNVAVDASGSLPAIEIELGVHETTILAIGIDLLPSLGLAVAIVDCYIDQSGLATPNDAASPDAVPVLVELECLSSGHLPERSLWSWRSVTERVVIESGLQGLLDDRLDTWRQPTARDGLRPDWTREGWLTDVSAWITEQLQRAGRPPPTVIVQFRHWGISAVVRVDQEMGGKSQRSWFKAVCPYFGHEPVLTQLLAGQLGDKVSSVIAIDADRRWMLLDDLGAAVILGDAAQHRSAFEHLVGIQRWSVGRISQLADEGVPRRPLRGLHTAFAAALADPVCAELLDTDRARLDSVSAWLADAIDRVGRLDIPEVLVHGDFHPGNIANDGDRHVLFDWSDAAVAPAFVDIVTWAWWLDGDESAVSGVWKSFAAAWEGAPWIDAMMSERALVEAVAGAFHTVSYAGIVGNLDRHRRPENALGLRHFFDLIAGHA